MLKRARRAGRGHVHSRKEGGERTLPVDRGPVRHTPRVESSREGVPALASVFAACLQLCWELGAGVLRLTGSGFRTTPCARPFCRKGAVAVLGAGGGWCAATHWLWFSGCRLAAGGADPARSGGEAKNIPRSAYFLQIPLICGKPAFCGTALL